MFEYRVTQLLAGGNISHLNERLNGLVAEGWEPVMMCGDANLSVLLRRQRQPGQAAHTTAARHPSLMGDEPTS